MMEAKRHSVPSAPPYVPSVEGREAESEGGVVHISNAVLATIARIAASKVPGVVDFVGGIVDGLAGIMGKRPPDRGVRAEIVDNNVVIELNVVLDYGVYIPKVAWDIQQQVRRAVEQMTGKSVRSVNVLVQGIRVPQEKKADAAGDITEEAGT